MLKRQNIKFAEVEGQPVAQTHPIPSGSQAPMRDSLVAKSCRVRVCVSPGGGTAAGVANTEVAGW